VIAESDLSFSIPKPEWSVRTKRGCDSVSINEFQFQLVDAIVQSLNTLSKFKERFCCMAFKGSFSLFQECGIEN